MNARIRKAAKNIAAGDLFVFDGQVFEARRVELFHAVPKMGRFQKRPIAKVFARLAHNGAGRLRAFEFDANRQVQIPQVGEVFAA